MSEAPVLATKAEKSAFLDAAIQNPDTQEYGSAPDDVHGTSIVRKQTLTQAIVAPGTTATVDIYIVQWDFEVQSSNVQGGGTLVGRYLKRNWDVGGTSGSLGQYFPGTVVGGWSNAINAIGCGGVCVYIMQAGQSPFPTNANGITGPCAPMQTIPLYFDKDVVSDQSRLIGANFEVNYTGPEVLAQGVWTQSGQPNNPTLTVETFWTDDGLGGFGLYQGVTSGINLPGSPSTMIKSPGAVQRPAYDGVLQNSRVDWSMNRPTAGAVCARRYAAQELAPDGALWDFFVEGPIMSFSAGAFLSVSGCKALKFPSNCGMHVAVLQGAVSNVTLQLKRTATFESFVGANSDFITFARPSPPGDKATMQSVENTLFATPQFWSAADNAGGRFSKLAKKIFNTSKTAVKVLAPGSKIDKLLDVGVHTAAQASTIMAPAIRNRTRPASKQTNSNSSTAATGNGKKKNRNRDVGGSSSANSNDRALGRKAIINRLHQLGFQDDYLQGLTPAELKATMFNAENE